MNDIWFIKAPWNKEALITNQPVTFEVVSKLVRHYYSRCDILFSKELEPYIKKHSVPVEYQEKGHSVFVIKDFSKQHRVLEFTYWSQPPLEAYTGLSLFQDKLEKEV